MISDPRKAIAVVVGAALAGWAACLCGVWAWAFDSAGGTTLVSLAAVGSALAVGAMGMMFLSRAAKGRIVLGLLRPGVATLVACGLAGLSVGAVFAVAAIADLLAESFLWRALAWTVVKYLLILSGSIPMGGALALGLSVLEPLPRRPDDHGSGSRGWFAAAGAALAVVGALTWLGVGLLVVMVLVGVVAAGGGLALVWLGGPAQGARGLHGRRGRWTDGLGSTGGAAVLVAILLVQSRLCGDIGGLSLWTRAIVAGVTLVGLWVAMRSLESRRGRITSGQAVAALVGLLAVALVQAALAIAGLQGGAEGTLCGVLAVTCQIPIVLLAAGMLSRGGRVFVLRGGGTWAHLFTAGAGAAGGVLGYLLAASLGEMEYVLPGLAVVVTVTMTALWARSARPGRRAAQVVWTSVLVVACAVSVPIATRIAREARGQLTPGFWLTAVASRGADGRLLDGGYLPVVRTWRSGALTEAITGVMSGPGGRDTMIHGHRGRWWVTRGCRLDFPSELPPRVTVIASAADPAAVPPGGRAHRPRRKAATTASGSFDAENELKGILGDVAAVAPGLWRESLVPGSERSFLQAAHTGIALERYDGAFLSGLPADHVQAWRVYNAETLRRWATRVHTPVGSDPGGVLVLRTQAGRGHLAAALAVARTFHETIGDSWVAADFHDDVMDLLIVGPRYAVDWPQWRAGLNVVYSETLVDSWLDVAAITIDRPCGWYTAGEPGLEDLQQWFRDQSRKD